MGLVRTSKELVAFGWIVAVLFALTAPAFAEEVRSPSVGAAGYIEQLMLPGSELIVKPLVEGSPIVIRITDVFPHGDSFRYDLIFYGMEPGKFDLSDWLVRKDGTSAEDLPEIAVEIVSLLPPGQIEPNPLEEGWIPRLGGYQVLLWIAIVFWVVVLFGIMFVGRKKPEAAKVVAPPLTLADLLRTRIQSALENQTDTRRYAELERMLTAFWQKRLGLEQQSPHEVIATLKGHAEAGPLMRQLETWMHSPSPDPNVDLAKLLNPYQELPADTPGFET